MTIRYRYIFPLLFSLLLALSACITFTHCSDDTPTKPPPPPPPPVRDTTSHEFTWELYKIGDTYGEMNDVWAIDDDHAIAVGRFTWQDSTGHEVYDSTTNTVELIHGVQHKYVVSENEHFGLMQSCFV